MVHNGWVFCFTMMVGLTFMHGNHKGIAWWGPLIGELLERHRQQRYPQLVITPHNSPDAQSHCQEVSQTLLGIVPDEVLIHVLHLIWRCYTIIIGVCREGKLQSKHKIQMHEPKCEWYSLIPLSWYANFDAACFVSLRAFRRLTTGLLRGDWKLLTPASTWASHKSTSAAM